GLRRVGVVAADGAVDDALVDRTRVGETQRAFLRIEEVVDDDVRAGDEFPRDGQAVVRFQVQRQRFLAAVAGEEVRADSAHERRAQVPRLIAAPRLFDLDGARAVVGEELGAERAGENAGEVGDDDALEGAVEGTRGAHRYESFSASRSARVLRRM